MLWLRVHGKPAFGRLRLGATRSRRRSERCGARRAVLCSRGVLATVPKWFASRSPSALLSFLGEGSPAKIDYRKKRYPNSNLYWRTLERIGMTPRQTIQLVVPLLGNPSKFGMNLDLRLVDLFNPSFSLRANGKRTFSKLIQRISCFEDHIGPV